MEILNDVKKFSQNAVDRLKEILQLFATEERERRVSS